MIKDFYIKNMVCDRCIKVLKDEIDAHEIHLGDIVLGRIEIDIQDDEEMNVLKNIIENNGFELINSAEDKLTEQVKIQLIEIFNNLPVELKDNLSTYLSKALHQDYSKISKVFSYTEGVTIEKYFIKLKIEKVKELIQLQDNNFTEIAQLLDYSNLTHLSNQFKSATGLSLTAYKANNQNSRNSLDKIM